MQNKKQKKYCGRVIVKHYPGGAPEMLVCREEHDPIVHDTGSKFSNILNSFMPRFTK